MNRSYFRFKATLTQNTVTCMLSHSFYKRQPFKARSTTATMSCNNFQCYKETEVCFIKQAKPNTCVLYTFKKTAQEEETDPSVVGRNWFGISKAAIISLIIVNSTLWGEKKKR